VRTTQYIHDGFHVFGLLVGPVIGEWEVEYCGTSVLYDQSFLSQFVSEQLNC